MPKFVGNDPPPGTIPFDGPSFYATWSQVQVARRHGELRLVPELVTTDKGGPGRLAKRWWAWRLPMSVGREPWATPAMKRRAGFA